ncbi:Hpt domain-containing protein [Aureimonas altamirensis]|uniref:Hpt domain-containing protein n=1 Tax=Aureimonas altamirensis TaxID=370622 RepID=UPI00203675B8|nr:Hpt domain-containing protein [Aureimonas altamirensis]MCM2503675.1 Hpt domain-containing protein [Aureimonas altamirensis]
MTRSATALKMSATKPVMPSEPRPSRTRPVDLVFLSQKTGGDRQIERDVLALLRSQVALIIQRAPHATRDEVRQMACAIRGAGRHVGAFAVADSAAELARADEAGYRTAYAAFMDELVTTADFLRSLD